MSVTCPFNPLLKLFEINTCMYVPIEPFVNNKTRRNIIQRNRIEFFLNEIINQGIQVLGFFLWEILI